MLAAQSAGHGLVNQGQAFGNPAGGDQGQAEVAEGAQLQVGVAAVPGQLQGPLLELAGPAGIRLQVAAQQPQPALERVRVQVAQQPLGPGQPATAGGGVVVVRDPGHAQADGGHRGRDGIPGPPEPGVGPFGVVNAGPGLAQPPQGDAHAVEGLGGLPLGQGGGESGPGLRPAPGIQGGGPRGQVVLLGHGAKYAHPTRAPE